MVAAPRGLRLRESPRQLVVVQGGENQVAADVDHFGRFERRGGEVVGRERSVRAERVEVAPVLSDDRHDHGLRGADSWSRQEPARLDSARGKLAPHDLTDDVVSDATPDCCGNAELAERDRDVRGAAARLDQEVAGREELARIGQPLERRDEHIRDDDPE